MRSFLFVTPALIVLGGCVNSYTEGRLTFVSRSTIFEPGATVVLFDDTPISVLGGPTGMAQVAGPASEVASAMLRRPDTYNSKTSIEGVGVSSASAEQSQGQGQGQGQAQGQDQSNDNGWIPPGHQDGHGNPDQGNDDHDD